MNRRTEWISTEIESYAQAHSEQPDAVLTALAAETEHSFGARANMQIGPDQGAFMTMLARLIGARQAVEVGTFTGYSSICIARGLADGGRLTCCDVSEDWTSVARRYWQLAGVADRIDLELRPAIETLRALPAREFIDFAFIDADKSGYIGYWQEIVPRTRPGGIILADNTLADGRAADPDISDVPIRAFNDHAAADGRVDVVLLTVGDGLTLARKR